MGLVYSVVNKQSAALSAADLENIIFGLKKPEIDLSREQIFKLLCGLAERNKTAFISTQMSAEIAKKLFSKNRPLFEWLIEHSIKQLWLVLSKDADPKLVIPVVRILSRLLTVSIAKNDAFYDKPFLNPSAGSVPDLENGQTPSAPLLVYEAIITVLTDSLFFPGVCIPRDYDFAHTDDTKLLWAPRGDSIKTKVGVESNHILDMNRCEVLGCLLVCFSSELYCKDRGFKEDKWKNAFLNIKTNKRARTLFYSLVNTICSFRSGCEQFFYGSYLRLVHLSLQIFMLSLDYGNNVQTAQPGRNIFTECFREKSFMLFYEGLFETIIEIWRRSTKLNDDSMPLVESFNLFWKMLNDLKEFPPYLLRSKDMLVILTIRLIDVLAVIIEFPVENLGIINFILLILFRLSTLREFSIQLNKHYMYKRLRTKKLAYFNNEPLGDILIIVIYRTIKSVFVSCGADDLPVIYYSSAILLNVSPFITKIGLNTSVSLLAIFEHNTKFYKTNLFSTHEKTASECLNFVLEALNSFVQYHYNSCPHLVYAILHKRSLVLDLYSFERQIELVHRNTGENGIKSELTALIYKSLFGKLGLAKAEAKVWSENQMVVVLRTMIEFLGPKVDMLFAKDKEGDQAKAIDFIRNTQLVGILPTPHEIHLKKFEDSKSIAEWIRELSWKVIINLNNNDCDLFALERIKMIDVLMVNE